MKKRLILFALISVLFFTNSQAQLSGSSYWLPINEASIPLSGKRQIVPQKYKTLSLNLASVKPLLFSAPNENRITISESNCVIILPLPNGSLQRFKVIESPIIMEPLATQFPDLKTFSIKGIDDPYANGKLDWTEFGFHGMVRSINGDFFIDPYCVGNTVHYISYYTSDFIKNPSDVFPEGAPIVSAVEQKRMDETNGMKENASVGAICVGQQLRTYRLALACTGEYAVAATGLAAPTLSQTLAKIVTSVNRVDGVYETEVAIRLVLVPTETNVVFTNAATDPFTGNNNAGTLIGESQTVITNFIGTANFDIGHTFSTGGGGLAGLGVVCQASQKASGITGGSNPVGDPYDIDYVAHEMGHQFRGNHTFNANTGSCNGNRNGPTSVEPGSGITIMAYAGICGANDLAAHSIAYFHAISYDEVVNFAHSGTGNSCAVTTTTGNQPPVVTGSGNYAIPGGTPFYLTGSATDPDGDPLTYSWEETDAGTAGANWNSGKKPYFMSYTPTTTPTRFFPKQSVVISGNYTGTKGEYLPDTTYSPQVLQFRLTARDNKPGGAGVCYAINTITISEAGPFKITYPSAPNIFWLTNSQQTITWNVENTDIFPVNCDSVKVSISYDGGVNYTVLLATTPNDGVQLITVPTVSASISTCRIKIEARGNIFYDISNNNFTITTDVGLSQISQNNPLALSVWPNPSTDSFNFAITNLDPLEPTSVVLLDVLGKKVMEQHYLNKSSLKETFLVSHLEPGIYFIKVENKQQQSVYRWIKE